VCGAHCAVDAGASSSLVDAEVHPDALPDGSTTDGALLSGSVCTPPPPGLRLVAPISASTVTSARPLLRLATVAGSTTDVQICVDRACTQVVWQTTIDAGQLSPTVDLAPGYWFWRAKLTGHPDSAWTSAWLFRVRRRAPGYAPLANTAVEPFADYNGDGFPDAVVYGPQISVFLGGPDGLSADRVLHPDGISLSNGWPGGPGSDLDGDGFTDLPTPQGLVMGQGPGWSVGLVRFGAPQGFASTDALVILRIGYDPTPVGMPSGVGDLDGDGFGDFLWPLDYGGFLFHGCSGGPPPRPWLSVASGNGQLVEVDSGDFDGDGTFDLVYADGATLDVYLDGSTRSSFEMEGAQSGGAVIDFNSDGYSDLIALVENSLRVFPGGPSGVAQQSVGPTIPMVLRAVGDFDGDGLWDAVGLSSGLCGTCVPQVFYGASGLWGTSPSPVGTASAQGVVVVDLNADGYDDVLTVDDTHAVAYFAGSPAGLPATPTVTFQP
jgi:hypothetical protein